MEIPTTIQNINFLRSSFHTSNVKSCANIPLEFHQLPNFNPQRSVSGAKSQNFSRIGRVPMNFIVN